MKRITHKQIKSSGWLSFINFVINEKLNPNDLKGALNKWDFHLGVLKLVAALEKSMYGKRSSIKGIKMMGLSKRVGK